MRLQLQQYFEYLCAHHSSRCVAEGEEVINAGHIISCGVIKKTEKSIHVYALCVQTSALNASPHEVQGVLVQNDQPRKHISVEKMACSCKAGQSGRCKHVSAVLIYCTRNDVSELNLISQTDVKCVWACKKQSVIENYNTLPLLETPCYKNITKLNVETNSFQTEKFREILERANPNSALSKHKIGRNDIVMQTDMSSSTKSTPRFQYFEDILNHSVQSTIMLQISTVPVELKECCKSLVSAFSDSDISNIMQTTMENKNIWQLERKYRITGSRCYSIYIYKGENWNRKSFNYFWPKPLSNIYLQHGLFYENKARIKYENITDFSVQHTGLIISNSNPWMAKRLVYATFHKE